MKFLKRHWWRLLTIAAITVVCISLWHWSARNIVNPDLKTIAHLFGVVFFGFIIGRAAAYWISANDD